MTEIQKQLIWMKAGMPATGVIDRDMKLENLIIAVESVLTNTRIYKKTLKEIADNKGKTLLGCNCDNYMNCDCGDTAYKAHERGANKAFENDAATAQVALDSAQASES